MIVIGLVDTHIALESELTVVTGIQPEFARQLGGARFGKQIIFAEDTSQECLLSSVQSKNIRQEIVSAQNLAILCDFGADTPRVYEVSADGETVTYYENTVRFLTAEKYVKWSTLVVLAFALAFQVVKFLRQQ
jgi:hypothetical protein